MEITANARNAGEELHEVGGGNRDSEEDEDPQQNVRKDMNKIAAREYCLRPGGRGATCRNNCAVRKIWQRP